MSEHTIVIDTPEGIAFFRALARQGAAKLGKPGIVGILREVYGFTGNPAKVKAMLDEYIEGTLAIREWQPTYSKRIMGIAQKAMTLAEDAFGDTPHLKDIADTYVQRMFDNGAITEEEGNDACLLLFVEVVRQHAEAVERIPPLHG